MATLSFAEPTIGSNGQLYDVDTLSYGITGGQTLIRGDLAILASGLVSKSANNPSTAIIGFAQHGTADVYFNASPFVDTQLFGNAAGSPGTGLMPSEPKNIHITAAHNNQIFEMSLVQAYVVATHMGATVGITLDGGTGFFVADTTANGNCIVIVAESNGPNKGVVGDVGKRVLVQFVASKLAV